MDEFASSVRTFHSRVPLEKGQMGCADRYERLQFKVFHTRAFELGVNQPAHCFLAIDNTVSAY
jgi:hypothetical protein